MSVPFRLVGDKLVQVVNLAGKIVAEIVELDDGSGEILITLYDINAEQIEWNDSGVTIKFRIAVKK